MPPFPFSEETLLFSPARPLATALPVIFAFPNQYNVGITSTFAKGTPSAADASAAIGGLIGPLSALAGK